MTGLSSDVFLDALLEIWTIPLTLRNGHSVEDQEDALQDAALALYGYEFESRDEARAFILTVWKDRLIDRARARGGRSPDAMYRRTDVAASVMARCDVVTQVLHRDRLRRAVVVCAWSSGVGCGRLLWAPRCCVSGGGGHGWC